MDPVTAATTTWTIAKTAGEVSKKLYELGKCLRDRDVRQKVDELVDTLREIKQSASDLEDENRDLRQRLRFKSDAYEFRTRSGTKRYVQTDLSAQSVLPRMLPPQWESRARTQAWTTGDASCVEKALK
jgi:hypothetical protein